MKPMLQCDGIPEPIVRRLHEGMVIPAHPLALTADRTLDAQRQRALSRYYIDAGAGGLAVGVHATQFAIREAGLYVPVLRLAAEAVRSFSPRPMLLIAGLCGRTRQALEEAQIALDLGYHAGLLSLAALSDSSEDELIEHCARVARLIPVIGFYLQPAVGGRVLSQAFWRRFAGLANVLAIKVAPFNRYRTLDVVRGVVAAGAESRVALYTGNDDHIVLDLVTPFVVIRNGAPVRVRFAGGLLGHWSVWVHSAVRILERCRAARNTPGVDAELLALDSRVTDCNSAFFDVANNFRGCIAGCHEVLRRQGLLQGTWCLDAEEGLSVGQAAEIDRVLREHRDLGDDDFVRSNMQRWLET
jgi:dihydrodipicolinate synthetase family protein